MHFETKDVYFFSSREHRNIIVKTNENGFGKCKCEIRNPSLVEWESYITLFRLCFSHLGSVESSVESNLNISLLGFHSSVCLRICSLLISFDHGSSFCVDFCLQSQVLIVVKKENRTVYRAL